MKKYILLITTVLACTFSILQARHAEFTIKNNSDVTIKAFIEGKEIKKHGVWVDKSKIIIPSGETKKLFFKLKGAKSNFRLFTVTTSVKIWSIYKDVTKDGKLTQIVRELYIYHEPLLHKSLKKHPINGSVTFPENFLITNKMIKNPLQTKMIKDKKYYSLNKLS